MPDHRLVWGSLAQRYIPILTFITRQCTPTFFGTLFASLTSHVNMAIPAKSNNFPICQRKMEFEFGIYPSPRLPYLNYDKVSNHSFFATLGPEDPGSLYPDPSRRTHARNLPAMVPALHCRRRLAHPRRGSQLARRRCRFTSVRRLRHWQSRGACARRVGSW